MAEFVRLLAQASRCSKCQSESIASASTAALSKNIPFSTRSRTTPSAHRLYVAQRQQRCSLSTIEPRTIDATASSDAAPTLRDPRPAYLQPASAFRPAVATGQDTSRSSGRQTKPIVGRVARAGLMEKTVRVEWRKPVWDNYLRKFYKGTQHVLVHDPASSLAQGDIVSVVALPIPRSDRVAHIVEQILVPFGTEISERPPVPSVAEYVAQEEAKGAPRRERREVRRLAGQGDEEAQKRLEGEGLGVRTVVRGSGRSLKTRSVLERDVRAGGVKGNVVGVGETVRAAVRRNSRVVGRGAPSKR